MRDKLPLLVVDGYNVIGATERYTQLIIEDADDPFEAARRQLISDIATFSQHHFEAHVVFDGAGNVSPERHTVKEGGVFVSFSASGESADELIERLAQDARKEERETCVVTSDNTIRATVGGVPVTSISSTLITREFELADSELAHIASESGHTHMTVESRLSSKTRAKLDALLGRSC